MKTYTNISADSITSSTNCIKVTNINEVVPTDLIRFGRLHVAIITEVEKFHNSVKSIIYCHSTSDYYEKYGVRVGQIRIDKSGESLGKQEWLEVYRGRNWTKKDYLSADPADRGLRRLRILANITS